MGSNNPLRKFLVKMNQLVGTLTVAQGGTGLTTLTSKNVLIGNGTGGVTFVAPGTIGNVLNSDGTNWQASGIDGGSITTGTLNSARLPVVPASKGGWGSDYSAASGIPSWSSGVPTLTNFQNGKFVKSGATGLTLQLNISLANGSADITGTLSASNGGTGIASAGTLGTGDLVGYAATGSPTALTKLVLGQAGQVICRNTNGTTHPSYEWPAHYVNADAGGSLCLPGFNPASSNTTLPDINNYQLGTIFVVFNASVSTISVGTTSSETFQDGTTSVNILTLGSLILITGGYNSWTIIGKY